MHIRSARFSPRRARRGAGPGLALGLGLALASSTALAGPRDLLIFAPGQGASANDAKPYLEKLFRLLEKKLDWPEGSMGGEYADDPKAAVEYIERQKPGFALLAPQLYFSLVCKKTPITPFIQVQSADVSGSGKYHVVVKKGEGAPKSLADLKGKRLSSNHLADPRFVSRLVFDGLVDAEKHFELKATRSSLMPFKDVDRGKADAALVDDNQLQAAMKDEALGKNLQVIYTSPSMPAYAVVSFDRVASPEDRKKLQQGLQSLCSTPQGMEVCKEMRLQKLSATDAKDYKPGVEKYCK